MLSPQHSATNTGSDTTSSEKERSPSSAVGDRSSGVEFADSDQRTTLIDLNSATTAMVHLVSGEGMGTAKLPTGGLFSENEPETLSIRPRRSAPPSLARALTILLSEGHFSLLRRTCLATRASTSSLPLRFLGRKLQLDTAYVAAAIPRLFRAFELGEEGARWVVASVELGDEFLSACVAECLAWDEAVPPVPLDWRIAVATSCSEIAIMALAMRTEGALELRNQDLSSDEWAGHEFLSRSLGAQVGAPTRIALIQTNHLVSKTGSPTTRVLVLATMEMGQE